MNNETSTADHKRNGAVQPRILAMIRPGVAYATAGIALALGTPRGSTRQALDRLTVLGAIVRRKIGPDCVFFADEASAAAWSAAEAAEFAKEQTAKRIAAIAASSRRLEQLLARDARMAKRTAAAAARQQTTTAAPVSIAPRPDWRNSPADTSRAVITRAPAPIDTRYYVDPGSIKPGAFVLPDMEPRWSDYVVRGAR